MVKGMGEQLSSKAYRSMVPGVPLCVQEIAVNHKSRQG